MRRPVRLLSPREKQVFDLRAEGLMVKEIAVKLGIATGTVTEYLRSIFEKLKVSSSLEAVYKGRQMGLAPGRLPGYAPRRSPLGKSQQPPRPPGYDTGSTGETPDSGL